MKLTRAIDFPGGRMFAWIGAVLWLTVSSAYAVRSQTVSATTPTGVIIEKITPGSAAEKAGLRVGDRILWYADRPINSPFDLNAATDNIVAATAAVVTVLRLGESLKLNAKHCRLGMTVIPVLDENALKMYRTGSERILLHDPHGACRLWQDAATEAGQTGNKLVEAWWCGKIFETLMSDEQVEGRPTRTMEAILWAKRGAAVAKASGDISMQALITAHVGMLYEDSGKITDALKWYDKTAVLDTAGGNNLWAADTLSTAGSASLRWAVTNQANPLVAKTLVQTRFNLARDYNQMAYKIRLRLAPDSLLLAWSAISLGDVAMATSNLPEACIHYIEAYGILKRSAPKSSVYGYVALKLGAIKEGSGDMLEAAAYNRSALSVYIQDLPEVARQRADILVRQAIVRASLGELADAVSACRAADEIHKSISPPPYEGMAACNISKGVIFAIEGDIERARTSFETARHELKLHAPNSDYYSSVLSSLGLIAIDQRNFEEAKNDFVLASKVSNASMSSPLRRASNKVDLAITDAALGNTIDAIKHYNEALAQFHEYDPSSVGEAACLAGLGAAMANSDIRGADQKCHQAVEILRQKTPGSIQLADGLNKLGQVQLRRHHVEDALSSFSESVKILESQRRFIVDLDTRALLVRQNAGPYSGLMQAYLSVKSPNPSKAFEAVERARGRALVDQMYAHLVQQQDPELSKLQSRLILDRESVLRSSSGRDSKLKAKFRNKKKGLGAIEAKQRQINEELQRRMPAVDPGAATLSQIQKKLERGTLALYYVLGERQCDLFAVSRQGLRHFPLPISGSDMEALCTRFHALLADSKSVENYRPTAQKLYNILIAPARAEVQHAERLLICPEGALYQIPFAALMSATNANGGKDRFLIEDKPLGYTMSLGVYLQTQEAYQNRDKRGIRPKIPLLAVGNPARTEKVNGNDTPSIPEMAELAETIGKSAGKGAEVRNGAAATVEAVVQYAPSAATIYIGCHGFLDNYDPIGSCLALAQSGANTGGILYAYDILRMKLCGSHVLLAPCDIGQGGANGNKLFEGIIGFPRAFLYAGARDVTAALWQVEPTSSAALVTEWYTKLRSGVGPAAALQQAQIKLIHSGTNSQWSDPRLWAPFVSYGLLN